MIDAPATADAGRRLTPSSCAGIGKRFPGVVANHDVDFTVRRGTVHALSARTAPASRR